MNLSFELGWNNCLLRITLITTVLHKERFLTFNKMKGVGEGNWIYVSGLPSCLQQTCITTVLLGVNFRGTGSVISTAEPFSEVCEDPEVNPIKLNTQLQCLIVWDHGTIIYIGPMTAYTYFNIANIHNMYLISATSLNIFWLLLISMYSFYAP